MAIRQLDEEQFRATFVPPMREAGEDAEFNALDISGYVAECLKAHSLPGTLETLEIHHVYISGDTRYSHVLLSYGEPNRYLVIVTDNAERRIVGHHLLDLNARYGVAG
jgi:hypothetical protein